MLMPWTKRLRLTGSHPRQKLAVPDSPRRLSSTSRVTSPDGADVVYDITPSGADDYR
jgi:hypothetical protein